MPDGIVQNYVPVTDRLRATTIRLTLLDAKRYDGACVTSSTESYWLSVPEHEC